MARTRKLPSGRYQGLYRDQDGKIRTAPGGPFALKVQALRAAHEAEAVARKQDGR